MRLAHIIAIEDFLDDYEERKYLRRLFLEKITRGLYKAREPSYRNNNGWGHD